MINPRLRLLLLLAAVPAFGPLTRLPAAPDNSDLAPPEKRRGAVEACLRLAKPVPPAPLPEELPLPFSPPGFEKPDPAEVRAVAASRAVAATIAATAKPSTDRELLVHIAARLQPSGTFSMGDATYLLFGQKRLRPGDILTVTYDGQDYPLELTAVDQSTFTLRFNHEEYTRPLKPGKNP